ncbi:MAG: hypothetical protein JWM11_4585 [Planctomycetaceae bacterium]|nr:hypothetical protein [Planctomycetaceae bacterium]
MREKLPLEKREPHRSILAITLEKTQYLANKKLPPEMQWFDHRKALAEKRNGPVWSCREFFGGDVTPTFQKRCMRAVTDLEDAGLLNVFRNVTHINLTKDGLALANRIANENKKAIAKQVGESRLQQPSAEFDI